MLQKIDKKQYIFFYLIVFLVLSSIHNSNFKYNNFFAVKKVDVVGLNKSNTLILEKKLVNLIGYIMLHREPHPTAGNDDIRRKRIQFKLLNKIMYTLFRSYSSLLLSYCFVFYSSSVVFDDQKTNR